MNVTLRTTCTHCHTGIKQIWVHDRDSPISETVCDRDDDGLDYFAEPEASP